MTEFQTRANGELKFFNTLKDALEYADSNLEVWKVSFSLPNGERIRLVKTKLENQVNWVYEPILFNVD